MNNLDILVQNILDVISASAPFAFTLGTIVIMFFTAIRLFDFLSCVSSRELQDLKKEVEKCNEITESLYKKYPPISPCDFHKDCSDCQLYNTSFCWKTIKERENIERNSEG